MGMEVGWPPWVGIEEGSDVVSYTRAAGPSFPEQGNIFLEKPQAYMNQGQALRSEGKLLAPFRGRVQDESSSGNLLLLFTARDPVTQQHQSYFKFRASNTTK